MFESKFLEHTENIMETAAYETAKQAILKIEKLRHIDPEQALEVVTNEAISNLLDLTMASDDPSLDPLLANRYYEAMKLALKLGQDDKAVGFGLNAYMFFKSAASKNLLRDRDYVKLNHTKQMYNLVILAGSQLSQNPEVLCSQ